MKGLFELLTNYLSLQPDLRVLIDCLYVLFTPGRPIEDDGEGMIVGTYRFFLLFVLIYDLDFRLGYGSARKERARRTAYYDQIIYGPPQQPSKRKRVR